VPYLFNLRGTTMKKYRTILLGASFLLLVGRPVQAASAIDMSTTHQTITGFGGMNFPRWIADLTTAQANAAFGNGTGQIGLSLLRISCSSTQSDWSKELPTAKIAAGLGANVFATPWSPPASMKSNSNIVGGSLNTASYGAYATYLANFVSYMKTNGINLYGISVQNEPDYLPSYESCEWTGTEIENFLKNNANVIPIKVIAAESFNYSKSMTDPSLNDAAAAANFAIVATHLYGASPSTYPLAASKGKELWMTEHYTNSTTDANSWPDALGVAEEIQNCMNDSFNAYVWWYIRRSYGLITEDGNVSKRGYCMAQFSKFIRPGFVRVDVPAAPSSGVTVSAYKNGGSLVVVLVNSNSSASSQSFTVSGATIPALTKYTTSGSKSVANDGSVAVSAGAFTVSLDAQSITTLVYTSTTALNDKEQQANSSAESANTPGDYEIFGITGARLGSVTIRQGQSLDAEVRKVVPLPGIYVARPAKGSQLLQIQVEP